MKKQSTSQREKKEGKKLIGHLDLTSEGYGFLVSTDKSQKGEKDVFIPPHALGGAMDGDQIEILTTPAKGKRRREGRVCRVLERAKSQCVGRFQASSSGQSIVISETKVENFTIQIPADKTLGAGNGQAVVVKITQYPDEEEKNLQGEVIKLLGERGDPRTEVEVTIARRNLPQVFSEKTLKEARSFKDHVTEPDLQDRRDLRSLPIVTIDGESAKDFDDGIFVQRIEGGYRLLVAIADVSHFVRPSTSLDREAYQRATSVYFPYRCIPMLPEELSNHLCSLVPHQDRLAFVAEMDFDQQGKRRRSDFYKAVIRNAERLTYTAVRGIMVDGDLELRAKYSRLIPHFEAAFELFQILREQRLQRGSIDFDLPEPNIILDMEEGIATSILKTSRTPAHMLIEDFMIAANEAVAEFMADKKLPMVYRIHESPDPEKMEDFRILAHNWGHPLPQVDRIRPKDLARLVQEVRGRSYERLINTMLLRSLRQAVYSTENARHFGLASEYYTHFTSPIRRYPDLLVHRVLYASLQNPGSKKSAKTSLYDLEQLSEMAVHCSKRERAAMEAEWEVRDLYVTLFMKDKLGEEYEGIISSVTKFGFFVELLDYFVEGLVHIKNLADDHYRFDEKRHELLGLRRRNRFQIGAKVRIRVAGVDIDRRKVDFQWVESGENFPKDP